MKKVLFVLESPHMGGTATSLFNLLSLWDSEEYEADLFFLHYTGPLLERAKMLRLLPEERIISSVLCPASALKRKGVCAILTRLAFTVGHRLFGVQKATEWFYRRSARKLAGKYDVVVAYQEALTTEYTQYIEAPVRIAWCHSNYLEYAFAHGGSLEALKRLYKCFDRTVCVSQTIREDMIRTLELSQETVDVVYNTISSSFIRQKAEETGEPIETGIFTFVSCGRFVKSKRFDRVVKAAAALREANVDFRWYLIGNGGEFPHVAQLVREQGLQDRLVLTGTKCNPFRYVAKADCFVMTSESEGQPMVLNEALTLGVPVITTEFPSAREVVKHGVDSLMTPNTDEDLVKAVLQFVRDEQLRVTLKQGANAFEYDNVSILKQIVGIFDQTGGTQS